MLNADAWAANTAEGETLCLMAGVVSVQTGGASDERLDTVGNCLRREPDGQLSRFASATDPVITGAIAATRFEASGSVVSTVMAEAAAEEAAAVPSASRTGSRSAPPVMARGPQPAAPIPELHGGWTVVVLSLGESQPIAARAQQLAQQGLPAVAVTAEVKGATMHRVAVGSFATQAEARAYASSTLAASGIKGWAAPL